MGREMDMIQAVEPCGYVFLVAAGVSLFAVLLLQ